MKFTLPRTTLMMVTTLCMASPLVLNDADARSNDRQGRQSSDYQSFRDNQDWGSERGGQHDQFDFQRTRNRGSDRDAWSGYEPDQYTQEENIRDRQRASRNQQRGYSDGHGFREDQLNFPSQRHEGRRDTWRDRQRSTQDRRGRQGDRYSSQQDQRGSDQSDGRFSSDRGNRQFSSDRNQRFSSDRSRQGQSASFRNQRERGYDGTRDPNREHKTIVPRGYDYQSSPPGLYEEDYDQP